MQWMTSARPAAATTSRKQHARGFENDPGAKAEIVRFIVGS